jgi:hypothetical protein
MTDPSIEAMTPLVTKVANMIITKKGYFCSIKEGDTRAVLEAFFLIQEISKQIKGEG